MAYHFYAQRPDGYFTSISFPIQVSGDAPVKTRDGRQLIWCQTQMAIEKRPFELFEYNEECQGFVKAKGTGYYSDWWNAYQKAKKL